MKTSNVAVFVVSTLLSLVFAEIAARYIFENKYALVDWGIIPQALMPTQSLDPYEMPSDKGYGHWVLRPGYRATVEVYLHDKAIIGRTLSNRLLKEKIENSENSLVETLRINSAGFIGEELDPNHSLPRVLFLGDSVTFGSGSRRYPVFAKAELEKHGIEVEIVNGGVEGYAIANLELELDRYLGIQPDVVTIMIGWNDIFRQIPWRYDLRELSRLVWLVERAYLVIRRQFEGERAVATDMRSKRLSFDRESAEVSSLEDYLPPSVSRVVSFARRLRQSGAVVCLVTLPSAVDMDMKASSRLRKIVHVPYFTDNPFTLAKIVERFNLALREAGAREGFPVFDGNLWARHNLLPREDFYLDSVHPTDDGLERFGTELGVFLTPILQSARMKFNDRKTSNVR